MATNSWQEVLVNSHESGSALTAAASALCIPTSARYTFPTNYFEVGKLLRVTARGIISCAVTTPGTARFRVYIGADVVHDSQAIPLNIVAKTDVGWKLEVELLCSAMATGATGVKMKSWGSFLSEAVVGSPLPSAGGSGTIVLPYSGGPVTSTGFDQSVTNQCTLFFEQTVATGSLTCQSYILEALN